jgi:hypothetical protein
VAEVDCVTLGCQYRALPPRPPATRIEDDANLPDDDDPWLDEEEPDAEEPPAKPKRPFWNR